MRGAVFEVDVNLVVYIPCIELLNLGHIFMQILCTTLVHLIRHSQ
jgi:hypothetical protein